MGGSQSPPTRQVVSCRLIIAPLAEADIGDSFRWYEQRSPGLGRDFMQCVETKLAAITHSPHDPQLPVFERLYVIVLGWHSMRVASDLRR